MRPMTSSRFTCGALAAAIAFVLAAWSPAAAAPITTPGQLSGPQTFVDFNGLTTGGKASPLTIGTVTFSAAALTVIDTDSYPLTGSFPTFVSDRALGIADSDPSFPNFTITFAAPVAQVGFGLWDPNFPGNLILAYDSAGNLLETTAPDALFAPGQGGADYLGFVRGTADIRRIEIVASVQNGVLDALWIDNLSYSANPVPEPGSLLLLGSGLLGVAGLRRGRGRQR